MPKRFLLVSVAGEGAWLAWWLKQAGHTVDYVVSDEHYRGGLAGLIDEKDHPDHPSSYDCILFDLTGLGKLADECRLQCPTLGDSTFADTLEHDRIKGLEFMMECGIRVPAWEAFDNPADALRVIRKSNKRYVYKACGKGADCSTSYVSKSADDMIGYIETLFRNTPSKEFILQEFVGGTEVSTEMWMNETGYYFLNHTLEEKKLLAGGLGPNNGCSGSVVWAPSRENQLFQQGLKKAYENLREAGYVGPIDLNAIVTDGELYGLEWTPRLGYDAAVCVARMLSCDFGDFVHAIAANERPPEATARAAFGATIRLSIPPYPLDGAPKKFYKEGVPLDGLTEKMLKSFQIVDARLKPGSEDIFETVGISGWIGCPIGFGGTIKDAFDACKAMISLLRIPDLQYRMDVPQACARRYEELETRGWLRETYEFSAKGYRL